MEDFDDALAAVQAPGIVGKIKDLLDRSGISPDDVARVDKVVLGEYQGLTKDAEGNAQIHDLSKAQLVLTPKSADGPEWPVVQQAAPTVISPTKPPAVPLVSKWATTIAFGDNQIGFRLIDGALDPFHDEGAMDVALQVVAAHENSGGVAKVVNVGDFLDLPAQSRFAQEAAFQQTMQPAIDRGHSFLAQVRATAPNSELVLIEGNHDRRLQNFVQANALAAFGLKQANLPKSWPVMSLPHLLRLDELGVRYIDAWPAGEYWINENLRAIHGNKVRSGGSTANAMVREDPQISTIQGHIHRIEVQHSTKHTRSGKVDAAVWAIGCMCRVDGAVPSANGAIGVDGSPVLSYENWQQAVCVIHHTDTRQFVTVHQIVDGMTVIDGQEFLANP